MLQIYILNDSFLQYRVIMQGVATKEPKILPFENWTFRLIGPFQNWTF